ncbi:hypothetical protein PIB30_060150 [Stylosanthes scabra]|uniref:Uncharacterized protein n=1 Tax=Stylosanthes scabra TaxID=79078 RepID=A0ABU6TKA0_9FABA|nr:hypothetical protein [Stylosanthes scabra]
MIGAGKNGPPGKYERWLSSASSGSVGLAMIIDRTFQVLVQASKVSEAFAKISEFLAFSEVQVFHCMSRRTRGVGVLVRVGLVGEPKLRSASKLVKHVRDLVDRFWGVTVLHLNSLESPRGVLYLSRARSIRSRGLLIYASWKLDHMMIRSN